MTDNTSTPATPPPAPASAAEVCERLKQMVRWSEQMHATYLSFFGVTDPQVQAAKKDLATLTAALALISQGEQERERLEKWRSEYEIEKAMKEDSNEFADFLKAQLILSDSDRSHLKAQLAAAQERVKLWQSLAEEGAILAVRYGVSIAQEPFAEDLKKRVEQSAREQPTPESK